MKEKNISELAREQALADAKKENDNPMTGPKTALNRNQSSEPTNNKYSPFRSQRNGQITTAGSALVAQNGIM